MIALAYSGPAPTKVSAKREGYDNGYRMGVFDRCNGKPADEKRLDSLAQNKYNKGYRNGYLDGYCSHDSEL